MNCGRPPSSFRGGPSPRPTSGSWAWAGPRSQAVVERLAGVSAGALGGPTTARRTWARPWPRFWRGARGNPTRAAPRRSRTWPEPSPPSRPRPGPRPSGAVFAALLERCDPLTARYVVKVLTGELRIGLRDGLLEAAIARAFERPAEDVQLGRHADRRRGRDGGPRQGGPAGRGSPAALSHPIKFMLASPAENAAEIVSRLGPTVWVEDKYDGIRAQLHRRGAEARLYSRDLNDISDQFPEIVAAARDLPWDGILDGEIVAYAGRPRAALPDPAGAAGPQGPDGGGPGARCRSIYVAFDLLAIGPQLGAAAGSATAPIGSGGRRRRSRRCWRSPDRAAGPAGGAGPADCLPRAGASPSRTS